VWVLRQCLNVGVVVIVLDSIFKRSDFLDDTDDTSSSSSVSDFRPPSIEISPRPQNSLVFLFFFPPWRYRLLVLLSYVQGDHTGIPQEFAYSNIRPFLEKARTSTGQHHVPPQFIFNGVASVTDSLSWPGRISLPEGKLICLDSHTRRSS
jgi:hypothetical protein